MNVKGLSPSQLLNNISATESVHKAEKMIKPDNANERDANGQELYQKQQRKKEKMTEDQFQKALATLNQKNFMLEMKWQAYAVINNDLRYAEVRSEAGEIIRRISEYDLWEVFEEKTESESKKGQLLKTVA